MRLENIIKKYKDASSFIGWFDTSKLTNQQKYDYYWDLARLLSGVGEKKVINIVKGRQVGMTCFNVAYASWLASKGKKVLVLTINNLEARMFIKKCDSMSYYCSLDKSGRKLFFCSGGEICAMSHNSVIGGMSEYKDLVIFDEFALFNDAKSLYDGLIPLVSCGGKILISSTPAYQEYPGSSIFEYLCNKHGYYHLPTFNKKGDYKK